jgi:hypothetical protein
MDQHINAKGIKLKIKRMGTQAHQRNVGPHNAHITLPEKCGTQKIFKRGFSVVDRRIGKRKGTNQQQT